MLSCPAHKARQNRTGEPPSIAMPNPRLTNFNRPIPLSYLPLRQMPVAHNQPLAILITAILVELNERLSPPFRSRPATACALLPGATVRKTTSLHLQLAYQARSLYSLALAHPFFLASSGEAAGFLFVTERSPRSRKRCRQDACRVDRNLILVLAFHRLPVSRYSVSVMRGDAPYGLPVDSV
jgi:hypothetical protein